MVKEGSKIVRYLNETFKLSAGHERLFIFVLLIMLFTHVVGCMWLFLARLNDFGPDTWVARYGYIDTDDADMYLICIYYILTTITTVGYGDITGFTRSER